MEFCRWLVKASTIFCQELESTQYSGNYKPTNFAYCLIDRTFAVAKIVFS